MKNITKNILHVYDFDNTLVNSNNFVYIRNSITKTVKRVPAHKFYEYSLSKNEEYDLGEFEKFTNPIILPLFEEFLEDVKFLGKENVAILTARYNPIPVKEFLKNQNVYVEVIAVGLKDPTPGSIEISAYRKKEWMREQIIIRKLDFLLFLDDCEENIIAAQELQNEYPNVEFMIELVK